MGLIRAYVTMLPRLSAAEQLGDIGVVALGSGKVQRSKAQAAHRRLEKAANVGKRAKVVAPERLAQHGIMYERA